VRVLTDLRAWAALTAAAPAGVLLVAFVTGLIAVYVKSALGVPLSVATGALAIAGLGLLIRDFLCHRNVVLPARRLLSVGAVVIGGSLMFAWNARGVFGEGWLAVASWNNDILGYAYAARHLAELGTASPGWIEGYHAGANARADVLGAYAILIPYGQALGDPLRATLPVMGALTLVIAVSGFLVILRMLRASCPVAIVGSLVFMVGFPMSYNAYQYFLSERLSIAVIFGAVVLVWQSRSFVTTVVIVAVMTASILVGYPQVMPIGLVVVAICALVGARNRWLPGVQGLLWALAAVVLGASAGGGVLAGYLVERIERARMLLAVVAGWPMPTYSLTEAVGLPEPLTMLSRAEAAAVELGLLMAILLGFVLLSTRRYRWVALVSIAFLFPMLVYVRFAFLEPDSYRQWKAMAFAVPFTVIAIIGVLTIVAKSLGVDRLRPPGGSVVVLVLTLALFISANNTRYDPTADTRKCLWPDCPIGDSLRTNMEAIAETVGVDSVAVKRGPYWPSMAAAYLLWGRPMVMREPNYWGVSDAPATYTLYSGELVGPTPN
jgi:hypothetical protein